jgi:hypothetical protein
MCYSRCWDDADCEGLNDAQPITLPEVKGDELVLDYFYSPWFLSPDGCSDGDDLPSLCLRL